MGMRTYEQLIEEFEKMQHVPTTEYTEFVNEAMNPKIYSVYTDNKTCYCGADEATAKKIFEANEKDVDGYFQIVYMDVWVDGNKEVDYYCNTEG